MHKYKRGELVRYVVSGLGVSGSDHLIRKGDVGRYSEPMEDEGGDWHLTTVKVGNCYHVAPVSSSMIEPISSGSVMSNYEVSAVYETDGYSYPPVIDGLAYQTRNLTAMAQAIWFDAGEDRIVMLVEASGYVVHTTLETLPTHILVRVSIEGKCTLAVGNPKKDGWMVHIEKADDWRVYFRERRLDGAY